MVNEEPEDPLAVLGVLSRVEDVLVPELVDLRRADDGLSGVLGHEDQKPLVFDLHEVGLLARPALTLPFVHQLDLDGIEVECFDACQGILYGPAF